MKGHKKQEGQPLKALFAGDLSLSWMPKVQSWELAKATAAILTGRNQSSDKAVTLTGTGLRNLKKRATVLSHSRQVSQSITSVVEEVDVFCVNLESPLSLRGKAIEGKRYTLRADPAYVELLEALRITDVTLANNHILDYGLEAFDDTCQLLDRAGIRYSGVIDTGHTQIPTIVRHSDSVLAMFSYVDPVIIDPDPNLFLKADTGPTGFVLDRALADIKPFIRDHAVIVSIHWGEEWSRLETEKQRQSARALIDSGAAMIIGHHTHVACGVEEHRDGLIIYGLGNLFMDLPPFAASRAAARLMVMAEFQRNTLSDYRLIGLDAIQGSLPHLSLGLEPQSLRPSVETIAFTGRNTHLFDSLSELVSADVRSTASPDSNQFVWTDEFLREDGLVRGLLPLGPGWQKEGQQLSGVRLSRELAGDKFLEVGVIYLTDSDDVEILFKLPEGLSRLVIITGYPDSLYLESEINPASLHLTIGDQNIPLQPLSRRSDNWIVLELAISTFVDPRNLSLKAVGGQSHQAVACFRILGL